MKFFRRQWIVPFLVLAFSHLLFLMEEENRVTRSLPVVPNPARGQVLSWMNHLDHRRHYLTALQHTYLVYLAIGVVILWVFLSLASWISTGMQGPTKWHVATAQGEFAQRALIVVILGTLLSAFFTITALIRFHT